MKTFEERYTAWIDNTLDGPALTSFELELSRRASAGEARADKDDAARLHVLLATHLKAPAMTNAEFFSHQLRERIDAERHSDRRRDEERQARGSIFSWPFTRLAGLSAALLFVATALYYGTMPPHAAGPLPQVAQNTAPTQPLTQHASTPAPEAVATQPTPRRAPGSEYVQIQPTRPSVDLSDDIQVLKVPASPTSTTATPLQYKDPNVNVLWINGLDYMPTVPGDSPAPSAPISPKGTKP